MKNDVLISPKENIGRKVLSDINSAFKMMESEKYVRKVCGGKDVI